MLKVNRINYFDKIRRISLPTSSSNSKCQNCSCFYFYSSKSNSAEENYYNKESHKYYSKRKLLPSEKDLNKIRNVGIMAHIDAGKTTTTERMLYLSGVISNPGEVHHGDTVTDFLPQERERGITIQSAVVNFNWEDTSINLIDTPGHVDFTFEVQRSLRVVDSAVAILDASSGVEAQTLTVWRQASENKLPRIIFLNKMDKAAASEKLCLFGISTKLRSTPILTQIPVYSKDLVSKSNSGLVGLIDLITMKKYIYDDGSKGANYTEECVQSNKEIMSKRCVLVDKMTDLDSQLADIVIESDKIESITSQDMQKSLKRITMNSKGVPILLGSSYRHVGVQHLINAISIVILNGIFESSQLSPSKPKKSIVSTFYQYLPNPKETLWKDPVLKSYGQELCMFAFKTIHDNHLGPLTFLRIFKGVLKSGQKIYNVNREKNEKLLKIFLPLADDLREIDEVNEGHVVVVSGLKDTITGDTLTCTSNSANSAQQKIEKLIIENLKNDDNDESERFPTISSSRPVLSGVKVPDPVFFCSIEPATISNQKILDDALTNLQREDPSFRVHIDPDSNQTILSGMGELHLEVIYERLKSEYKVDADLGKIQIQYKEKILEPITKNIHFERKIGDIRGSVTLELELVPIEDKNRGQSESNYDNLSSSIKLMKGKGKDVIENLANMNEKHWRILQNGIDSALKFGPKLSLPVVDLQIYLNYFQISSKRISDIIIEAAAAKCVRQCLMESSKVVLLEPFATLEVIVDEKYQQIVLDDLNRRRFQLTSIDHKYGNNLIYGTAPLSEFMGYSTTLRTLSSGLGTFSMEFNHYKQVSSIAQEENIIKQIRGF